MFVDKKVKEMIVLKKIDEENKINKLNKIWPNFHLYCIRQRKYNFKHNTFHNPKFIGFDNSFPSISNKIRALLEKFFLIA